MNTGTGPGEITADGCAVDFYALLPEMGEAVVVHAAVPPGASVLELGCGTGRILRPLAGLGHPVLGVDESPAMLAHVPDLPTFCGTIEELRLDRRFGAVLLASHMINARPSRRRAFLAACGRHVDPEGVVVIQRYPPAWFAALQPREQDVGGIRYIIRSARPAGSRWDVLVEYQVGDRTWTHAFSPHQIGDHELAADLASAGLEFGRWLTDDRSWFTAHPAAGPD